MNTEEFIGCLLYFKGGYIETSIFQDINEYLQEYSIYDLDVSEFNLQLIVNYWKEYFEIQDNILKLTDYYQEYKSYIRTRFYDQLSDEMKEKILGLLIRI